TRGEPPSGRAATSATAAPYSIMLWCCRSATSRGETLTPTSDCEDHTSGGFAAGRLFAAAVGSTGVAEIVSYTLSEVREADEADDIPSALPLAAAGAPRPPAAAGAF
ncbi:hypothetical protein GNI_104040, partial [Gregarina niphandrodes]